MKIEIEKLDCITPNFRGGGNNSNLKINVQITPHQAELLFYLLWEEYGDEYFKKWLKDEGYNMEKIK